MDYSLLVGILNNEDLKSFEETDEDHNKFHNSYFRQDNGGIFATNKENEPIDTLYFLGIIDILQPYNLRKKVENKIKLIRENANAISCIAPKDYSKRFQNFIR